MKHYFLIFGFVIACSTFIYGQDNKLIYSKQVSNRAEKSSEILRKSTANVSVDFVEIDLEKILNYEQLTLQFGEKSISVNKVRLNVRGVNNFSFIGKNYKGSQIVMSVLDDDIQGVIETIDGVFSIETVGKNDYAIIKIDQSKLKEGCGDMQKDSSHSNIENDSNHDLGNEDDNSSIFPMLRAGTTYDCKIRVLVLYTPNAQSSVSNIKNTVLEAVDLTNESFINSNIDYQIELAYVGLTNYTETGNTSSDYLTALDRFKTNGDGYMDEVHTLRNKYSADVCVLLVGNSASCGLAYVYPPESYAFCVVTAYNCATANYSFAHEIGHTLGCLHDIYVDNDTYPFAYGHGYIYVGSNAANSWRTIMAYNDYCAACGVSPCRRLGYWANPNVNYNGIPTGTVNTNNTARVWNEQSDKVMAFRQPDNNVTVTSSDIPNTRYADIIAKQNITTSGTVNVVSGNSMNMRAGNSIILGAGFSVALGAEFSAAVENIYDCGSSSSPVAKVMVQNIPEENDDMADIHIKNMPVFSYSVYPNPTDEFINITYSLDTDMLLSIELVNLFGQKIKTVLPKQNQQAGTYTFQIPVSDFSSGTYFLTISSVNQTKTEKIIINK